MINAGAMSMLGERSRCRIDASDHFGGPVKHFDIDLTPLILYAFL